MTPNVAHKLVIKRRLGTHSFEGGMTKILRVWATPVTQRLVTGTVRLGVWCEEKEGQLIAASDRTAQT